MSTSIAATGLEAASEHRPRFLVVGARGAGGFSGQILGSATAEAVRWAKSPVLVVKWGVGRCTSGSSLVIEPST